MGRREENKADKRRRIERAARALFKERGFEATTTRAIAERAEVAAGTVFLYAPNKGALLRQMWAREVEDAMEQAFEEAEDAPGLVEWLVRVHAVFLALYAQDPELSRLYLRELVFPAPDAEDLTQARTAEINAELMTRVSARFEAAQATGEVHDDVIPLEGAQHAFGVYLLVLVATMNGTFPPDAAPGLLRRGFQQMLAGFGPAGSEVDAS